MKFSFRGDFLMLHWSLIASTGMAKLNDIIAMMALTKGEQSRLLPSDKVKKLISLV